MKAKIFLFALAFAGMTYSAQAQVATKSIKGTQRVQQARIHQGIKEGDLTRREAKHLYREQVRVQRAKVNARRDGVVTPVEKMQVRRMQKQASRNITRQRNDRQSRN